MKCPRCNKTDTSPIDRDSNYVYCLRCNYSFKNDAIKEVSGELHTKAGTFVDALKNIDEISPQERMVLNTAITSDFMAQWFDGFKAGQLASIVHAKKYYQEHKDDGKDRDDNQGSGAGAIGGAGKSGVPDGATGSGNGEAGIDTDKTDRDQISAGRVEETINGTKVRFLSGTHDPVTTEYMAEFIESVKQHCAVRMSCVEVSRERISIIFQE